MDAHVDDGELAIHLVLIIKFCTLESSIEFPSLF